MNRVQVNNSIIIAFTLVSLFFLRFDGFFSDHLLNSNLNYQYSSGFFSAVFSLFIFLILQFKNYRMIGPLGVWAFAAIIFPSSEVSLYFVAFILIADRFRVNLSSGILFISLVYSYKYFLTGVMGSQLFLLLMTLAILMIQKSRWFSSPNLWFYLLVLPLLNGFLMGETRVLPDSTEAIYICLSLLIGFLVVKNRGIEQISFLIGSLGMIFLPSNLLITAWISLFVYNHVYRQIFTGFKKAVPEQVTILKLGILFLFCLLPINFAGMSFIWFLRDVSAVSTFWPLILLFFLLGAFLYKRLLSKNVYLSFKIFRHIYPLFFILLLFNPYGVLGFPSFLKNISDVVISGTGWFFIFLFQGGFFLAIYYWDELGWDNRLSVRRFFSLKKVRNIESDVTEFDEDERNQKRRTLALDRGFKVNLNEQKIYEKLWLYILLLTYLGIFLFT